VARFARADSAPSALLRDERIDMVRQLPARPNTALPREPSETHKGRHAIGDHLLAEPLLSKPREIALDFGGEPTTSNAANFPGREQLLQHENLLTAGRSGRRILDGLPLCGHPRPLVAQDRCSTLVREQNGIGYRRGIMFRGT
jgi:hypothetical protein